MVTKKFRTSVSLNNEEVKTLRAIQKKLPFKTTNVQIARMIMLSFLEVYRTGEYGYLLKEVENMNKERFE